MRQAVTAVTAAHRSTPTAPRLPLCFHPATLSVCFVVVGGGASVRGLATCLPTPRLPRAGAARRGLQTAPAAHQLPNLPPVTARTQPRSRAARWPCCAVLRQLSTLVQDCLWDTSAAQVCTQPGCTSRPPRVATHCHSERSLLPQLSARGGIAAPEALIASCDQAISGVSL